MQKLHSIKADEYEKENGYDVLGAFYWGQEIFIPERFLNQVKIIGKQTKSYRELLKREEHDYLRHFTKSQKHVWEIAVKLYNKNIAAKYYVDLKNKIKEISSLFDKLKILFAYWDNTSKSLFNLTEIEKLDNEDIKKANFIKNEIEKLIK